jgi:nucleotide-binding universal stress UspA family protein
MNILIATDGTKYGNAATSMLDRFRLKSGDEVRVVSVVDMAVPMAIDIYGGYLPDTGELEKTARENADKIVLAASDAIKATLEDVAVTVSTEVLFGSPDSRIVETAEEMGADLIIVGSHGYRRWARLLLGSVSSSVVHHAPCSVMVVRVDEEEDEAPAYA